jgi:hypothetical protein
MLDLMGNGENARIHRHFLAIEPRLRAATARALDPPRRLTRALLLDEVARYGRERRYPINRDFKGKCVPYFVDEAGTRCAVAHLLEIGGQPELVQRIAARRNHARVRELADEPELLRWLAAAGLSVAEAALIQPDYCEQPDQGATPAVRCCSSSMAPGVVEVTVQAGQQSLVDAVYGSSSQPRVGDTLMIDTGAPIGNKALLAVRADGNGGSSYSAISAYPPAATVADCQGAGTDVATLAAALTQRTLDACVRALNDAGPAWSTPSSEPVPGNCGGGMICGFGRGNASESVLGTLLVLSAILAYRRRRAERGLAARGRLPR